LKSRDVTRAVHRTFALVVALAAAVHLMRTGLPFWRTSPMPEAVAALMVLLLACQNVVASQKVPMSRLILGVSNILSVMVFTLLQLALPSTFLTLAAGTVSLLTVAWAVDTIVHPLSAR
jgi:hypothetical protein